MLYPEFQGLPVLPSKSVRSELQSLCLDLYNVVEILELGYDCAASKRKEGIIERCIDVKRKTIKAVVDKSFNYSLQTEVWVIVWVIVHVGIFSKRR